jgi:enoyl-CoA hydratase/carnithine racemase
MQARLLEAKTPVVAAVHGGHRRRLGLACSADFRWATETDGIELRATRFHHGFGLTIRCRRSWAAEGAGYAAHGRLDGESRTGSGC